MTGHQQPSDTPANLTQRLNIDFALQAAGLGVWELDPVTKQVLWDDRCRQLFGLAKDNQLPYQQAIQFIHPDDQARVDQAVQQVLSGQSNGQYDMTYRTVGADDGLLRWVRFMGRAEFTPAGQVHRFAGVAQEVTQQVLSQQQVQQAQDALQGVLAIADMGTWTLDVATGLISYSQRLKELFEFTDDTIGMDRVYNPILDADQVRVAQAVNRTLDPASGGLLNEEYTIVTQRTGRHRIVRAQAKLYVDEQGRPHKLQGSMRDVTQERDTQLALEQQVQARTQELEASEARYRELAQSLEAQVRQRTQALATANEELATINEELRVSYEQERLVRQQLEASEARFRSLIEEAPVATCLFVGRELRIEVANQRMIDVWGRGTTVLGKPLALAIPEAVGQPFLDILDEVYTTGKSYEAWASRAEMEVDGVLRSYYFDLTYKALCDADGQVYAILCMCIDVTQQVMARRESEANLRQFRTLLQAIPQMTWTNTPTGEVDFYNERWYAYTGLSFEQTRDWGWQAVVHPDDLPQTLSIYGQALATGEEFRFENRYRRADGQYRWHLNRALPLYADDGQIVKWVGTATDIHEQKQVEAQLDEQVQQRTQELAATNQELTAANLDLLRSNKNLEQFAYIASHDMQEPLRKIQQFGDLLRSQYGDRLEDGVAYLERMQTAATRMSVLIRDLLAFSRISTTQVIAQPVALNQVVSRVLETLSIVVEETGAQVEVASLPVVPGDRSQLDQLFQNLLSNAFKFRRTSPAGELVTPQISVKASLVAESQLPPSVQPSRYAQTYHCIEVADNGIGFDEKYLDRIFQVFQRLHGRNEFTGTGIGLSIVQKVVTNHGGAITATSQPGQGATFKVYLPA